MALSRLDGLVIIDEIQTVPEQLPILQVIADNRLEKVTFLILIFSPEKENVTDLSSITLKARPG